MLALLKTRVTLAWLVLLAVTAASLTLSRHAQFAGRESVVAAVLVS
jgi:hypothetical protein